MENYVCKIVLIGQKAVGKSTFINKYVNNNIADRYYPTVGIHYDVKYLIKNSVTLKIEFMEIGGGDIDQEYTKIFLSDATIIMMFYDITDLSTLNYVRNVFNKTVLIANKKDLSFKNQMEDYSAVAEVAKQYNITDYFLISSVSTDVCNIMNYLIQKYVNINDKLENKKKTKSKKCIIV